MKSLLMLVSLLLPWDLRRRLLIREFGFEIHPTARIGLAWVFPQRLVMAEGTSIGDFTVVKNLDLLQLGSHSLIGRGNWITGFPRGNSPHFAQEIDRRPELIVGEHSAITHRHLLDCTNSIRIGRFSTVAGFQSQFISHTIDIATNRQTSRPIAIGDYCFIGTNCVVLGGAALPSYSVLGAKSLLNKAHTQTHRLYGGVPARELSELPPESAYFNREQGFVV